MEKFNFDDFKYYLILIDILDKKPDLKNYHSIRTNRSNYGPDLCFYEGGFHKLAPLKIKDTKYLHEAIYIFCDDFIDSRMVISFLELKIDLIEEAFSKDTSSSEWWKIKKHLLWEVNSKNFFGEDVRSIFQNSINDNYSIIKNPYFIYIEHKATTRPPEDIIIPQAFIRSAIEKLQCHENYWAKINYTLQIKPSFADSWNCAYFINLIKSSPDEGNIYLPYHIHLVLKIFASYSLLVYRYSNLKYFETTLSFTRKILGENDYKKITSFQNSLNENFGEYSHYYLEVIKELPEISTFHHYFEKYINQSDIDYSDDIRPSFQVFSRILHDIENKIKKVEYQVDYLNTTYNSLLNYTKEKHAYFSSCINLKLQTKVARLTYIITFLTIILALESKFIERLFLYIVEIFSISFRYWLNQTGL